MIRVYDDARNVIETHERTAISKSGERCRVKQRAAMR